jgi:hypothetical protein
MLKDSQSREKYKRLLEDRGLEELACWTCGKIWHYAVPTAEREQKLRDLRAIEESAKG